MSSPFVPGLAPAELPTGQVHIWLADPDLQDHARLEARHGHLLSAAERARHQAFRFARDRHLYLAAHALARRALAHYTGIAPGEIGFAADAGGKPRAVLPPACGDIAYNLSHTSGLVACVLGRDMACGVDVELRRPLHDMMAMAATVFSAAEVTDLAACPPHARETCFFTLWTLREAYAKATGEGILGDLSHLSFSLAGGGVDARFDASRAARATQPHPAAQASHPTHAGDAARWRFHSQAYGERHLLAVAALPSQPVPAASIAFVQHCYPL